jgi:prevent-host-death family protein
MCLICLKNKQIPDISRNLSKNWFARKICTNFRSLFDGQIGMNFSTDELIPFSDARSGLSRVIEEVMGGRELVVTRHGKMTVALVAASQLYQYREMERELNEFLATLEHDKSGSDTKLAVAALKRRMAAKREDFESFMSKVPNAPPFPGDEVQE